jgi:hypothetical protein
VFQLSLLCLLAGCPGLPETEDTTEPDAELDTSDAPPLTDLPTSTCGPTDYEWVPRDQVGTIVSWERASELDLTAEAIRGVIGGAGFPTDLLDIQYDVRLYRFRYLTQDRGETVEATALLSFPETDATVPTLAWLHGTTGFTDECAPSGQGIEGAAGNLLLSSLGVAVVAPDYLGMNGFGPASDQVHPYIIAEPTAVASLDALRAAWALIPELSGVDATVSRETILFGGSEGGFAALWSERYAPWYLPSADMVGVVASVPPTDVVGLAEHGATVEGATSLALAAALATYSDWYGFEEPLSEVLTDDEPYQLASTLLTTMDASCDFGDAYSDIDSVEAVYTETFRQAVADGTLTDFGPWGCALAANSLATGPFERISDTPILYVYSGADDLVYHQTNRDDIPRLCAQGYDMDVIECAGANHTEGAASSIPLQWAWVQDRLNGVPMDDECGVPDPIQCLPEG